MRRTTEAIGFWAIVAAILIATGVVLLGTDPEEAPTAPPAAQRDESHNGQTRGAAPVRIPHSGETAYVGNTNSYRFHVLSCSHATCPNCDAPFATREEAVAAGFRPCGTCKP